MTPLDASKMKLLLHLKRARRTMLDALDYVEMREK